MLPCQPRCLATWGESLHTHASSSGSMTIAAARSAQPDALSCCVKLLDFLRRALMVARAFQIEYQQGVVVLRLKGLEKRHAFVQATRIAMRMNAYIERNFSNT